MKTIKFLIFTIILAFTLFLPISTATAQSTKTQYMVRLVYFLPKDRPARPERVKALRQLIKDAQVFYADEMERHGYGRKTFTIETDRGGEPVVHRVNGRFKEAYYYERISDPKILNEVYENFNALQHIYFVAIDLSYEVLNSGDSCGLGGIGFFPMGGGSSPLLAGKIALRNRHETQGEEAFGGATIIPASGKCFRDDVTLHELGHGFGLEHDFRLGLESHYVMSFGKAAHYQMRLSAGAAEWLSVSAFFNNKPISGNTLGEIQLIAAPTYSADRVRLRFKVADADGLHQVQLLVPEILEYGAWGAERLFDYKRLKGKTNTVEFISEALKIEPVDRIMVQTIDMRGDITWATFLTDIDSILPRPKTISVPDKNLKKAIQEKLGLNPHANITDRDMKTFRSLKLEDREITNISGLEYATELEHLFLGRNKISNYDPLAQLSKLKRLFLWANDINDLNVLPPMPQLELLDLNWNQISDLSPLAEFTSLKELWLQGNKLANTSTVFQLHNGIFPPDEEIKVVEERDNLNRSYILLTLESLDLMVRVNPDVTVFRSLNSVPTLQQPVPLTDVIAERSGHPPMYWINTKTGTLHRLVGSKVENLLPSVRNAISLAIDITDEKLYWVEKTGNRTGRIRRANLDGTNMQLVKNLKSVPRRIAIDAVNAKLYLVNSWGKIQRLNFDGSGFKPNLITDLKAPKYLALDIKRGKVYWIEKTSRRTGKIRRANLDGTSIELIKNLTGTPLGFAVDSVNGKIYLTNAWGKVQRLNLNGSNFQPNLLTGLKSPREITVDVVGSKLYWTEKGSIRRAGLKGENVQDIATGLGTPTGIALSVPWTQTAIAAAPATTVLSEQTSLLANYPNPFNPETWVPYRLSEPAEVKVHIYAVDGRLIRTLVLGHQPAGMYQSKNRAAYWDGKNELGESVASGVYFYTLTAGNFIATRKMLIRK